MEKEQPSAANWSGTEVAVPGSGRAEGFVSSHKEPPAVRTELFTSSSIYSLPVGHRLVFQLRSVLFLAAFALHPSW